MNGELVGFKIRLRGFEMASGLKVNFSKEKFTGLICVRGV